MQVSLELIADKYVNFEIAGKTLSVPYMINDGSRYCSRRTRGKGNASEMKKELIDKSLNDSIDLGSLETEKIRELMQEYGIGIDCSGIVCQVLEEYLSENFATHLVSKVSVHAGLFGKLEKISPVLNNISRINATTLLSPINTTQIDSVKDIKAGDFIGLTHPNWPTKHIVLVIKVTQEEIYYLNSSDRFTDDQGHEYGYCEKNGVHIESIRILDPNASLDKQNWSERTFKGENYGEVCFRLEKGDRVRRLRLLQI